MASLTCLNIFDLLHCDLDIGKFVLNNSQLFSIASILKMDRNYNIRLCNRARLKHL